MFEKYCLQHQKPQNLTPLAPPSLPGLGGSKPLPFQGRGLERGFCVYILTFQTTYNANKWQHQQGLLTAKPPRRVVKAVNSTEFLVVESPLKSIISADCSALLFSWLILIVDMMMLLLDNEFVEECEL